MWVKKITALLAGGGYFLLPIKDFHAIYAVHITPIADTKAISNDKISYNDNPASPPSFSRSEDFG